MVGNICISTFPFYDIVTRRMSFKNRPVLVIGKSDVSDYIVLPISRVTHRQHLDDYYDIPLNPANLSTLNLTQQSYIRTHKQTVINSRELTRIIVDFRTEYPDIFLDVMIKVQEFQKQLIEGAIS